MKIHVAELKDIPHRLERNWYAWQGRNKIWNDKR